MNTVEKGRIAEAKTVAVLISEGIEVFLPVFGNGTCDLIAMHEGHAVRIEVKYTSSRDKNSYLVQLRQVRANRANIVSKNYNAGNSDILAAYVAPLDKVVFLSSSGQHGKTAVCIHPSRIDSMLSFSDAVNGS